MSERADDEAVDGIGRDGQDLKPLLDYLGDGKSAFPKDEALGQYLADKLPPLGSGQTPSVYSLVVSLPDPIAGAASPRFDEYLDVLQRAVELQGFVLDRFALPWRASHADDAKPGKADGPRAGRLEVGIRVEAGASPRPRTDRPGLMVFRKAFPTDDVAEAVRAGDVARRSPALMLVFLVPESPVRGLDKAALVRSLELLDRYFFGHLTEERERTSDGPPVIRPTGRKVLHLLTPCFSGSQTSLEAALLGWKAKHAGGYHFRVVSGSANQAEERRLNGLFTGPPPGHRLTFHSMVHKSTTVRRELLDYLEKTLGYRPRSLAILIESNTGLSQALFQQQRRDPGEVESPAEFLFPLQVSEMRKAYDRIGLLGGGKLATAGAPERLPIPPDEAGTPRDLPLAFTPAASAATDEMALTQVLTTISHRRYEAVGIVATNPFDVVFLARQVQRFCPNVRLFAIQSDLLLARPQEVPYLRGMLVASTYPLYPSNQWMSPSTPDASRVFFSDQGSQALYNAAVAHLWEMGAVSSPHGPPLLEFGPPYHANPGPEHRPPVWISAVGERGAFPVSYVPDGKIRYKDAGAAGHPELETRAYLYSSDDAPELRASTDPGTPQSPEQGRKRGATGQDDPVLGMQPNPHLLFWLVCLFLMFACVGTAGFTWCYVRWAADPRKESLESRVAVGPFKLGFRQVLLFFNTEVARDVGRSLGAGECYEPLTRFGCSTEFRDLPPVGADPYVALVNILIWVASSGVFSLLTYALAPYVRHGKPGLLVWFALVAITSSAATASMVLSLADTALRYPRRRPVAEWLAAGLWHYGRVGGRAEQLASRLWDYPRPPVRTRGVTAAPAGWIFRVTFFAALGMWVLWISVLVLRANSSDALARVTFERITNLPGGVTPVFPVFFLLTALGAWIYGQVARLRLYRRSYLPSLPARTLAALPVDRAPFDDVLFSIRDVRETLNELIVRPYRGYLHANRVVLWVLVLLGSMCLIRFFTRGLPRSFEGHGADRVFFGLFALAVFLTVAHSFQLLGLWRNTRQMLRHAIALPMTQAFDRVPARLKGWFYGEEDFAIREQLALQQCKALKHRSTEELVEVFEKLFGPAGGWRDRLAELHEGLDRPHASLDSSRAAVYPFLRPLWTALPVEDMSRERHSETVGAKAGADWVLSWPLLPKDVADDDDPGAAAARAVGARELKIVRDWARTAEDLLALQIVRWFAPALAQFLPIMTFLVIGSLSLLFAVSSYPFDHQGWLMTVVVFLILFVGSVIGTVMVGVNRDELISRVSDTTPGQLSLDSGFVSSLLTMIVPLFAALLAVSFDLSDLLHTWFGPLFQTL